MSAVPIPAEEAAAPLSRCPDCNGKGDLSTRKERRRHTYRPCRSCNGTGMTSGGARVGWRANGNRFHACGRCLRCDTPWALVEHHSTYYSESGGCFPLCERCWDDLGTAEERLPFYRILWHQWMSYGRPDHNGMSWDDLWAGMEAGVRSESEGP